MAPTEQRTKDQRAEFTAMIVAGFAANPAIFAANSQYGWGLVNCDDAQLVTYARTLADHVIAACEEQKR